MKRNAFERWFNSLSQTPVQSPHIAWDSKANFQIVTMHSFCIGVAGPTLSLIWIKVIEPFAFQVAAQ